MNVKQTEANEHLLLLVRVDGILHRGSVHARPSHGLTHGIVHRCHEKLRERGLCDGMASLKQLRYSELKILV